MKFLFRNKNDFEQPKIKMKIFSFIAFVCMFAFGASLPKRTSRKMNKHELEPDHQNFEHSMQKTIMQDLSTFYDIMLSDARSLTEVNAVLAKRYPHFNGLSQNDLDVLASQWLFQMLSK